MNWRSHVVCLGTVMALSISGLAVTSASVAADTNPATTHPAPTMIDGGGDIVCRVEGDGGARCWGRDFELGGTPDPGTFTAAVAGVDTAVSIAAGDYHGCVLLIGGDVRCWGENGNGQLGDGTNTGTIEPVAVALPEPAVQIDAGGSSTCALLASGAVNCWGDNLHGQLGNGTSVDSSVPVAVVGLDDAVDVGIGSEHACAVRESGLVTCWGDNSSGELGDGNAPTPSPVPADVSGLDGVVGIAVGSGAACALDDDGAAWCWGDNGSRQLGRNGADAAVPETGPPGNWVALDMYYEHACAVDVHGDVTCWGSNFYGQIGAGDGAVGDDLLPVELGLPEPVVAVAAGRDFTCVLDRLGDTRCWGNNTEGLFESLVGGESWEPVTPITTTAIDVTVGARSSCAMRTDGATCWGYHSSGQLGGASNDWSATPVDVEADSIESVSVGERHACGVTAAARVTCWGSNSDGRAGQPGGGSVIPPATMADFGSTVQVDVGQSHACARITIGFLQTRARCWGENDHGQLGDGTTTSTHVPVAPSQPLNVVDVSAGDEFTCVVVFVSGAVHCWGVNDRGQLGDGTTTESPNPVMVAGLTGATQVSVGGEHACARAADGSVWCWGHGLTGQLGDGSSTSSSVPVQVSGISDAVSVEAGSSHACALRADASLWCWGSNFRSALGDPVIGIQPTPVEVATQVDAFDLGQSTTCVVTNGAVQCWGSNIWGQLGEGPWYATPQLTAADDAVRLPQSVVPFTPGRLFESRDLPGQGTIDGEFDGVGRRTAESTTTVPIRGRGPVPDDARGVVVNVAAVNPSAPGFLTFYRCDEARPLVAHLNFVGGVTIANGAVIGLDELGQTCVYTSADTDLTVDVTGYVPAESALDTDASGRLLDTRESPTVDGEQQGIGRRVAGSTTAVELTGRPGVAEGTDLVTVNIVAVKPAGAGFMTVHRCDQPRPLAANLTYAAGVTIANGATVEVDANGEVCVYSSAETDLVVDLAVTSPPYERLWSTTPSRLLDSRPGESTVDGAHAGAGVLAAGSTYKLEVAGRGGVPGAGDVGAVSFNVAAVNPAAVGFLTFFPCDVTQPLTSNLNYAPGANVSNTATIALDGSGDVCIFTSAQTHVVVDVNAYTRV